MKQSLQTSLNRKLKSVYLKKWSAPTVISVFIIVCMLFIFTCETIGLTSKKKVVTFRYQSPEMNVKSIGEIMISNNNKTIATEMISSEDLITKIEKTLFESKEAHIRLMQQILVSATKSQMNYMNYLNSTSIKNRETIYQYYDV